MAYANLALKFSTHLLPHACSSRMSTPQLKRSQSITTLEIHPLNLAYRTAASRKKLLRTQGFANTTFDLEESASGVGRCCRHRFGYAFGDIMAKRHSPAVKFDPPSLYHPRTIDDPLAMIELFSLDELCKDRKPICIAALHDFTPTKPLVEASSPDKEWQLPPH